MSSTALLFEPETQAIIGCASEVLNVLGHGLNEKCYGDFLAVEFRLEGIRFSQQRKFEALHRNGCAGLLTPGLIAYDQVIVVTKVIDRITEVERGQMLNDLLLTKLKAGLILNFKHPCLEWESVVSGQ
jgi:GxxExxY protein